MSILSFFKKKITNNQIRKYPLLMDGTLPVFNSFGDDIYASDIVKNCIRCVSTEISKLQPKHIRNNFEKGSQEIVADSINRLLKFGVNPLMTTSDFLEMITYMYEVNNNVFIYPTYEEIECFNGNVKRKYTGIYPLKPTGVEFLQDEAEKLFVKFSFADTSNYTIPYSDVIHWRKDFGKNEFVGGDINSSLANKGLLKVLQTEHDLMEGLSRGIKLSSSIRGIVKLNTLLDTNAQMSELAEFEEKLKNAGSGLLPMDLKNEYIPINLDPKFADKETMEFIYTRILNNFGVSLPIFNGNFTEEQYQAFYEKKLEPMIISLGRAFSRTLFTHRELELGHEVIFYNQGLLFSSMQNKINVIKEVGAMGVFTDNQILSMLGFPPFEGGDVRHMSLNYIDRDIANSVQLGEVVKKDS